jgi:hypothetical protein
VPEVIDLSNEIFAMHDDEQSVLRNFQGFDLSSTQGGSTEEYDGVKKRNQLNQE